MMKRAPSPPVHDPTMRRPGPKLVQLLLAAATCSFLLMTTHADANAGATCVPHERDALLAFKRGITRDPAGILHLWRQPDGHSELQDCCRWRGVRCSNRTGHVLELRLGNPSYDTIYSDTALVGQISHSLLALEHLQHLDLSNNNLSGSTGRIPEFLGSLRNFHGRVLPLFGNLTALRYLDLSGMGATYSTDVSWLAHLRFLQYLNLDLVNLNTVTDWPHVVSRLPSLRFLRLSGCSLTGTLPEWVGQLTSLVSLDLSRNSYAGPLAEFIGNNLTGLRILDLSWNNFTGPLPESISYLGGLRTLDVSYNNLNGVITEEHFRNLRSLQHIDLSSNSLNIEISSKWQPPFRLRSANFATCGMGPLFPAWLQWLVDVDYLDISSTGINDKIPDWLPRAFSDARYLSMSRNKLSGQLPANVEIMSSLEELDLNNNTLTGQLPKLPWNLTYLDICINSLSGSLPANIGLPKLQVLSIASNSITGRLPRSICKCKGLRTLVLADNHFKEDYPIALGTK
ncbi:hypothetical protein C2845_PM18G09420 [Panicum miliaceum]|uniref:Uncharacterized protein n=1 Tax=Panicum miliaceum TaxID=4540 RepID=A0A3L6PKH0_PANMI|nr:hypothetical protein C2845_PM18G09420 [Panicum miliaceum]